MLLLIGTFETHAADSEGRFAIKGTGTSSCERFLVETSERSQHAAYFAGWLNGFMTSENRRLDDTFDVASWESFNTLVTYLANFCAQHPKRSFFEAVAAMTDALRERRVTTFSPRVDIDPEGGSIYVYREVIERAQRRLSELGHFHGEANGQFDRGTRDALTAFQRRENLQVTGLPDQETLHRLFVRPAN